jgi:hypothetical protein
MRPPPLDLRIEEIVLHGYDPGDRRAFADALQRELTALFAQPQRAGWPAEAAGSAHLSLNAGAIEIAHGARPHTVAAQVAGAIHRGVTQPPSHGRGPR